MTGKVLDQRVIKSLYFHLYPLTPTPIFKMPLVSYEAAEIRQLQRRLALYDKEIEILEREIEWFTTGQNPEREVRF